VIRQSFLKGAVYLENNLTDHVFTTERLNILTILAAQASISIENARLYEDMEDKVRERTNLLRQANVKLRELSLIDPLTRLNNRRFFLDHITGVTEGYIRKLNPALTVTENRNLSPSETVMGVFLIDIDHFKQVNDTWGHAVGDAVLVSISKTLKSLVRTDDFIVRWGGEEFLIILNQTNPAYLDRFAQRVLQAVKAASVTADKNTEIHRTCSIGYGQIPFCRSAPEFLSLEQSIKLSDYAMYVAKQSGRNQAVCISPKDGLAANEALRTCLMALSRNVPSDTSCVELRHLHADE
jgi:histidine kinase